MNKVKLTLITVFILSLTCNAYASEFSTFEAFYKETSSIGWLIAAIFAVIAAAVIYFTGGTASPIVVSIGTWIGNMMGLSGIAATNAGLALLGGGSIASGGFGIIGGVAVLTAALSFGTDVVIDFTAGKIISEYSYSRFAEQSKSMTTLPIPRNDDGTKSYKAAVKILVDDINSDEPISSNYNQRIIRKALRTLEKTDDSTFFSDKIGLGEKSKKESLYSLLYFLLNEYRESKQHADSAIKYAREVERKRTLPAFIFATCNLYEKNCNFNKITQDYFRYSILAEPDNPIIPLLFSAYLDRMMYRFNDGYLSASSLQVIVDIANEEPIDDNRALNFTVILARYFMRLKIEQQKITSLTLTQNKTIKNNPKTLHTVKKAINEYSVLLRGAKGLMEKLLFQDIELDDESKKQANHFYSLLNDYINDRERLNQLIIDLENYQKTIASKEKTISPSFEKNQTQKNDNIILYLLLFLFGIFIILLPFTKKEKKFENSDVPTKKRLTLRLIKIILKSMGSLILICSIAFGVFGAYGMLTSLPSNEGDLYIGAAMFLFFSFIPFCLLIALWKKKKANQSVNRT